MHTRTNAITVFTISRHCTQKVTGELVKINEHGDWDRGRPRGKCYSATYKYVVDDKEYMFTPKKFVNDPQLLEIGSSTEVRYCPTNPEICIIKRPDKIGVIILCIIIGAIILMITFS